jgi:hypothetical protein
LIFAFELTPDTPRAGAMPWHVSAQILAESKVVETLRPLPSSSTAL